MNQQQYLPSEDPLQQLLKVNHMLHLLQIIIATFLMGDKSCQSFAKNSRGLLTNANKFVYSGCIRCNFILYILGKLKHEG